MKLAVKDLDNFIKTQFENNPWVLIYGQDSGLIAEVATKLQECAKAKIENFDASFNLIKLNYDIIQTEPLILAQELLTPAFNLQKKIIIIEDCKTTFNKDFEKIIEQNINNYFVIFLAQDLSPTSSLRKFFETSKNLASIACYHDDLQSVGRIIASSLNKANIKYNPEVFNFLVENLRGDRLVITSELHKITENFSGKTLKTSDLINFIKKLDAETEIEPLLYAYANNKLTQIQNSIDDFLKFENSTAFIRLLIYHFFRLYQASVAFSINKNINLAINDLRPKPFFKAVDAYKKILTNKNSDDLALLIENLIYAELAIKQNYELDEASLILRAFSTSGFTNLLTSPPSL